MKPDVGAATDGRSTRWAEHRASRREQLLDAALQAIAEQGSDVGMDQIAAGAGTSKPVVYRYFADKDELYRAVTHRVVAAVLAALRRVAEDGSEPRELIHASVEAYLALLEQSPQLFRFVVEHPQLEGGGTFSVVIADLLADELAGMLGDGGLDPAYAHPWGEAIVGFITAASLWWVEHPGAMTRARLTDYLAALLWGGAAGVQLSVGRDVDPRPAPGVFPPIG